MKNFAYLMCFSIVMSGCRQEQTREMNKSELLSYMKTVGEDQLGLIKIDCLEPQEQHRENELICFAAPYDAEEFMSRVDSLKDLNDITGWRDDYGTASKATQYQQIPHEVGFIFTRPNNFWDMPVYQPLRKLNAQGYVSIIVTDDDPKTRQ